MLAPELVPVLRLLVDTCDLPQETARGYLLRWQAEHPGPLTLARLERLEGLLADLSRQLPDTHPRLAARALHVLADEIDVATKDHR